METDLEFLSWRQDNDDGFIRAKQMVAKESPGVLKLLVSFRLMKEVEVKVKAIVCICCF